MHSDSFSKEDFSPFEDTIAKTSNYKFVHNTFDYSDIQTSSFNTTKKRRNPFVLPPPAEMFGYDMQIAKQMSLEKEKLRGMSLIDRTNALKSSLPPLSLKNNIRKLSGRQSQPSGFDHSSRNDSSKAERTQRMTEFILEKRQIFLVQLIIDRKNMQISKIQNEIAEEEQAYLNSLKEIEEESQKIKFSSTQADSSLVKARKAAEASTHTRVELSKELKRVTLSTGLMKNDIHKNEELLESFNLYYTFLQNLTPKGKTPEEYFGLKQESSQKDPSLNENSSSNKSEEEEHNDEEKKYTKEECTKVISQLNEIEKESLFLINECNRFDTASTFKEKKLEEEINEKEKEIQKTKANIPLESEYPSYDLTQSSQNAYKDADKELQELTQMIYLTYYHCFAKQSEIPILSLLEKIENALEEEYQIVEQLNSRYVREAQARLNKNHREEERKMKQQKAEEEQQRKMEQAIERAKQPIKKKKGRPVLPRSTLRKIDHHDEEKKQKILNEKKKEEDLLYGPWSQ